MITSSKYIDNESRGYSLYVIQSRALPAVTDGLKSGGRRALWVAKDGKKYKTATLAGAVMPLHPHSECSSSINTLAAPYGNNITLFDGSGAFGTLVNPTAYGAPRYTSVVVSKFTQDVMFRDIEIVPMTENYDGTLEEPVHFLPLVPVVLLNPSEGIAVGFATNILPRRLEDIIKTQTQYLKGKSSTANQNLMPFFAPLDNMSYAAEDTERGRAFYFNGAADRLDTSTVLITKLPYGQVHEKVISKLEDLVEKEIVVDYADNSKNKINIEVKFKRGYLKTVEDVDLYKMLGITIRHVENLNVLDFSGKAVWNTTPSELIHKFTDWRLSFYPKRYQRLIDLLDKEIQRYKDVILAIEKNIGGIAKKIHDKAELVEVLESIGVVDIDYISTLPVYRFTLDEYNKTKNLLKEALATREKYVNIIKNVEVQKNIYISELEEILKNYNKGTYSSK